MLLLRRLSGWVVVLKVEWISRNRSFQSLLSDESFCLVLPVSILIDR